MNQCQVLNEIEKIVDSTAKRDILLSRNQADDHERERVVNVIGEGREKSLYATSAQGHKYSPPA